LNIDGRDDPFSFFLTIRKEEEEEGRGGGGEVGWVGKGGGSYL